MIMEYKVGDVIESGLVACNECKNKRVSNSMFFDGNCLASPRIKIDYDNGTKYIAGYHNCCEINANGNCNQFEKGNPTDIDIPEKWWQFWKY